MATGDLERPLPTPAFAFSRGMLFLRRNFVRIGIVAGTLTVVLFGALSFYFNQYSATTLIIFDPRAAKIAANPAGSANAGPDVNTIDSLVLLAKSDAFLGALVDRLELVHDEFFSDRSAPEAIARAAAIEKLRTRLNVFRRGTTYVIEATAVSASAETSAKIANAAAQKIINDQSEARSGASEKTAQNIEGRLADLRHRLIGAENATAELKAKLKVTDAGQGSTLLERRVSELNQQLVLASAKTGEARARLEQLRKAAAGVGDNLSPSVQSSLLNALRIEYVQLTRLSADRATVFGKLHPEVASLRAQIADVKGQIGAEIARMMATTRTDFLEAEQREALLARQLKDTQGESGALGPQLVKLGELERAAKAERSVYEQLLTRARDLTENNNVEPSDMRVVSPAVPPARTVIGKTILAAAAAGLGLLCGVIYALMREAMRRTLTTPRQAERLAGVEVAGMVPFAAHAPTEDRPDLTPWLSDLCASLASNTYQKQVRAILVTSARRGEGRSTVAASIAAYCAEGRADVLLVEADSAASSNAWQHFGLINVLEQGEDLQRGFVKHATGGYTLLPFGRLDAATSASTGALMNGMTLRAGLKLCRQWFDIVVIDGPPVLEAEHARLLAQQADLTVFVAEWDKTSPSDASDALDRIDASEAVLIFNKVDIARFRLYDPALSRRLTTQAGESAHAA